MGAQRPAMSHASVYLSRRILHFGVFLVIIATIISARLFWFQIRLHDDMSSLLERKLMRTEHMLTGRGSIRDRNGTVLAEDMPSYQLAVIPEELALDAGIVQEIEYSLYPRLKKYRPLFQSGVLPTPAAELREKVKRLESRLSDEALLKDLSRNCGINLQKLAREVRGCLENCLPDKKWHYLSDAQPIDIFTSRDTAHVILANRERFAGIRCLQSAIRSYPRAELCSHVVGYLGKLNEKDYKILRVNGSYCAPGIPELKPMELDAVERFSLSTVKDFLVGVGGTELVYNNDLRSRLCRIRRKASIGEDSVVEEDMPDEGKDVQLTLDAELQATAMDAMAGRDGAVVLFDLDSGEILVSVSIPTFDPNMLSPRADAAMGDPIPGRQGTLVNKVACASYPFGSVYKIITAAAAIEEDVIRSDTTFLCQHVHPGTKLTCLGDHGHIGVEEALERSCNIFFYDAGMQLGIVKLHNWSLRFCLGRKIGTGFPYEKAGIVPSPGFKLGRSKEPWQGGDTCNSAIGQGFQLGTPMQAAVVAGLAAREKITMPRYWMDRPMESASLGIKDSTRNILLKGLWKVVNSPGGTASGSRSELVCYAGKTGTAEISSHKPGHQYYKMPHAWFSGFAPFDSPRVAISVLIENGGHGGDSAAPVAKKVLEAWAGKYLKKAPGRT